MARARNIKPGFFKNYDLADLGPHVQLLFAGLWCLADREGRLKDQPRLIKAEVFPYYDTDVNGGLTLLNESGFVKRYMVDGVGYIQILKFKEHQSPHNTEKASTLPGPEQADKEKPAANPHESSITQNNRELTVDSRKSNGGNSPDLLIHRFTDSPIPDSPNDDSQVPPPNGVGSGEKSGKAKREVDTGPTWDSYISAFQRRYRIAPVRNAKTNRNMLDFVKRIGEQEAPLVAEFYLQHNKSYYVSKSHDVGTLLMDAESLRTQWATGNRVTATQAQQADRTQSNFDAFAPLLAEAEARERAYGKQ